jgi:hypothetical protein
MKRFGSIVLGLFAAVFSHAQTPYQLIVETHATHTTGALAGQTTYRLYIKMQNATDFLSSIYGNNTAPLILNTSTNAFYNDQFATGATAGGVNSAFFMFFPTLASDSWVTIGISQSAVSPQADVSSIESAVQPWKSKFTYGAAGAGTNVLVNDLTGGAWYLLNGTVNGLPAAGSGNKVLCMQVTTAGVLSGRINAQIFPLGVGANQLQRSFEFSGPGTFNSMSSGVPGCTSTTACNYNSAATTDNGSCVFATGCDTCSGGAVVDGDTDNDGVCNANEILGCQTAGACNYNAAATDAGSCIFATGCDTCSGGAVVDGDTDNDGVCNANEIAGCTIAAACNYNAAATDNNGSCIFATGCDFCANGAIADGDTDNDGVCNANEIAGCTDSTACNYNANATDSNGTCDYCSCAGNGGGTPTPTYTLTVEQHATGLVPGQTTYRFYIDMLNSTDFLSSVYGNNTAPLQINTSTNSFYNDNFTTGATAGGVNPAVAAIFPTLAGDSWVTIGISSSAVSPQAAPSTIESSAQPWMSKFTAGSPGAGTNVLVNDVTGGAWYLLNGTVNGIPAAGTSRVLIMQMTTAGTLSGRINAQIFPLGVGGNQQQYSFEYSGLGTFNPIGYTSGGGGSTAVCGCTDATACNYDAWATMDDGLCVYATLPCEYCSGSSDGTGFVIDADSDNDGVCWGEVLGCQSAGACNYNPAATGPGTCIFATGCDTCIDGAVADGDTDNDGVCDTEDLCVGVEDTCGICNGPGAIYACGCSDIPVGDCDCNGNQLDALGVCGGLCAADADGDGTCDDVDPCVGAEDACGICNGPGAIYACGCTEIPAGDCDCTGNQLDALGVCGGLCAVDGNGNGVCDSNEGCTHALACNYNPGALADDGSCTYCCDSEGEPIPDGNYSLTVEQFAVNGIQGMTTYRVFVDLAQPTDFLSAIYANNEDPLTIATSTGSFYNNPYITGATAAGGNPLLFAYFPAMAFDSWVTIGLTGEPGPGQVAPYAIESVAQPWRPHFAYGTAVSGSNVIINDVTGGSWFITNGASNGYPSAGSNRVLCMQITTAGTLSGVLNAHIFPNGVGSNAITRTFAFQGVGTFSSDADAVTSTYCGCTNPAGCNYNPEAITDDGNCIVPQGCDTCANGLLVDGDANGNGICDVDDIVGCSIPWACNFEPEFTVASDGLCAFALGCDTCVQGVVVDGDANDNGVCDPQEILGCTLASACNFNEQATTNDGSCEFSSCYGCMDPSACNYVATATTGNLQLCTYPLSAYYTCSGGCAADADGDGICDAFEAPGCTDPAAANYLPWATDDDGSCVVEIPGCILPFACTYAPGANVLDLALCVFPPCLGGMLAALPSPTCTEPYACNFGAAGPCDFVSCLSLGCTDAAACNYDASAVYNDGSCDYVGCLVPGCTLTAACNYDASATSNDGSCEFLSCVGCTNPLADNYDPTATLDAGCVFGGCVQPTACNYDATANSDDGSCDFVSCSGCMSLTACNFDATASISDAASCIYPAAGYGCDGVCLADSDGDGVCDPFETPGCTDASACNYVSGTLVDDGSCVVPVGCESCVGGAAVLFDADADGVCDSTDACSDLSACNYVGAGVGGCQYLDACGDCGGTAVDSDGDGVCDPEEVPGCTDFDACNFSFDATEEDGSCDVCACLADSSSQPGYALYTETVAVHTTGELAGLTTYRLYIQSADSADIMTSITGNSEWGLEISTSTSFWQSPVGGVFAESQNPVLLSFVPNLLYDSYVTVGLTGPANAAAGQAAPSALPGSWVADFEAGGPIVANSPAGSGWYVVPTATNARIGATRRILIAQLTTDGQISGSFRAQVFPGGLYGFGIPYRRVDIAFGAEDACGCTSCTACNYDPSALYEDGSCTYALAGYDCAGACLIDADNDGVCDQNEVVGCQNATACNYAPAATNAGYCAFPDTHYNCLGACLSDADGDGVCDALEVDGCTSSSACNYSASATDDDGSCSYAAAGYTCSGGCAVDSDSDGICDQNEVVGCQDASACNYAPAATNAGYCAFPDTHYDCLGVCLSDADGDGVCDPLEVAGCTSGPACNFDPGATDDDGSCTYAAAGYTCAGGCVLDSDYDGVCDQNEIVGCQNASACNYAPAATNAGYCAFPVTYYDCLGVCLSDIDGDGVCDALEVDGCTAGTACNFNPAATDDDGSCTYAAAGYTCAGGCVLDSDYDGVCDQNEIVGCQNPTACNYAPTATNAGYCDFPDTHYDCSGVCLSDSDGDGVCDVFEISGCTHAQACNYNATATDDNGFCVYALGCDFCSGGAVADGDTDNDGVCNHQEISGCQHASACNYDPSATNTGSCDYPATHYDCSGACLSDVDGDGVCDPMEVAGCTSGPACNFNPAATDDDGSCTYAAAGYTCAGGCILDSDSDGICDQNEVVGCQNPAACNYAPTATNGGYCDFPATHYDCSGVCLSDADGDGVCDTLEVEGCTDPVAINFYPWITESVEVCAYEEDFYMNDCPEDLSGDGVVGTSDLLMLLSAYNMWCP